ncbi:hypothetical protein SEENIN0B_00909 [Salmonella enterica subsp. enterica serovar Infantis str. SARB27]|uniref:Uncharacterized protein n=1 Tax=Salmonella enterica subsp. enterica serovar Infantis str. SARB27 TaxID=596155 RepID=A0A6C8G605_SALIN|nr:hypothetical protein SEENIN0B_00909 [Salmonella enterica subsp. enterica serovar Infantis str. SARB27]
MMYVLQNLLIAMRPGDFQYFRMHFADLIFFCAQAAGDDYLTVFVQRFANGFQRLLYRAVNKATGINDNHIRIVIAWHNVIAFGTQLSQDAFRINEVFRTAQGNEADLWLVGYITHSLKSVHLLEWSGQGFYRYPNKNCIAISSGAAASTVVVVSKR